MVKRFSRLPNSFQNVAMMNADEMFVGRIFCSMIFVQKKTESRVCVLGLGYRPSRPEREEKVVGKTVIEKSLFSVRRFGKSPTRAHSKENISINTHTRAHTRTHRSFRERSRKRDLEQL